MNPAFLIEGAAVIIAASTFIWLVIFVTVETIKKNGEYPMTPRRRL